MGTVNGFVLNFDCASYSYAPLKSARGNPRALSFLHFHFVLKIAKNSQMITFFSLSPVFYVPLPDARAG